MSTQPPPGGYYPQQAYYAPGWQQPVGPPPPRRPWGKILMAAVLALVLRVGAAAAVPTLLRQIALRPLGEVTAPTEAGPRQLRPGHCVQTLPADGELSTVAVVPCDQPHEAEVIALHTFDDGPWPGPREVARDAAAGCEMDAAQAALGAEPVVWSPTQGSWAQGDRLGTCLAWHPSAPVVGSWTDDDEVAPAP